jgi:hypothetical protein
MDIKKLVEIFTEHEIQADKNRQDDLIAFVQNHPGEEVPDHMKDNFNICRALKMICKEIVLIKEKLDMK